MPAATMPHAACLPPPCCHHAACVPPPTCIPLVQQVAAVVREVDADVLLTWDARASLGFLLERSEVLGVEPPLLRQLGRTYALTWNWTRHPAQ
jgi:hypothetical protein